MSCCCRNSCPDRDHGEKGETSGPESRLPYHSPSVFTPCTSYICPKIRKFKKTCMNAMNSGYKEWKKIYYGDPFKWELIKSLIFITIGLKAFNEYFKYLNTTPTCYVDYC